MSVERIALVAGANQGVGLEVATKLAANGVTVYLGSRDPGVKRTTTRKASRQQLGQPFVREDVAKGGGRGDHKQDADVSCTETDVGLFYGDPTAPQLGALTLIRADEGRQRRLLGLRVVQCPSVRLARGRR